MKAEAILCFDFHRKNQSRYPRESLLSLEIQLLGSVWGEFALDVGFGVATAQHLCLWAYERKMPLCFFVSPTLPSTLGGCWVQLAEKGREQDCGFVQHHSLWHLRCETGLGTALSISLGGERSSKGCMTSGYPARPWQSQD